MTISRRKFLEAGVLTSIITSATLKSTTLAATHRSSETKSSLRASSIDYYNKSTFRSYVNSDFRIANGRGETWLRLVLVEDFPAEQALTAPDECFRLLFSGALESSLEQGTYQFKHSALGAFPLFIVPGTPAVGKRRYEAVFNRLSSWNADLPSPPVNTPFKKR
ncbi:MAG TPA: hypothetical protein VIT88_14390 [Pyrinomonadaceae bacterium]